MSPKTTLKQEAISIYQRLQSPDADEVKAAMGEYLQLVDRFYEENKYLMAPEQYGTAKKDFEYFMVLVELAEEYHKDSKVSG